MPKGKPRNIYFSMTVISLIATAFVSAIVFRALGDPIKVLLAAALTFGIVFGGFLILNWAGKEDKATPGEPRLK